MNFNIDKTNALTKLDKSKKGSIDSLIKPLCDIINSLNNYYTTSSCSGRIVLLETSKEGKKCDSNWLFFTHKTAKFNDLKTSLKKISKETVWFIFEPVIMHIACRDVNAASKLLQQIRSVGFKRSGIISTDKLVIELRGTERLDVPVAVDNKLIVEEKYLQFLVNEANKKIVKNEENIDKLFNSILELKS